MLNIFKVEGLAAYVKQSVNNGSLDTRTITIPNTRHFSLSCISADESTVAIADNISVKVFDTASETIQHEIECESIEFIHLNHDGTLLVVHNYEASQVMVIELVSGDRLFVEEDVFEVTQAAVTPSIFAFLSNDWLYTRTPEDDKLVKVGNNYASVHNINETIFSLSIKTLYHEKTTVYELCPIGSGDVEKYTMSGTKTVGYSQYWVAISEKFLLCVNRVELLLFDRSSRRCVWGFESNHYSVSSVHITADEKHFVVCEHHQKHAHLMGIRQRQQLSRIPQYFVGGQIVYDVPKNGLVWINTCFGSLLYQNTNFITDNASLVPCLAFQDMVFFTTCVIQVSNRKEKIFSSHNGIVKKVSKESDILYRVEFEDEKIMMLEWTKEDGFGRDYICKGNLIDMQILINEMQQQLDSQRKAYSILQTEHNTLKEEVNEQKVLVEKMMNAIDRNIGFLSLDS
ncbi:hypothetical protein PCE1_003909 [Barthelona sp. PCE]